MITLKNFFDCTIASFKACKVPKRQPDYVSHNKYGAVSSTYWYGTDKTGDYVIRKSNHWSHIRGGRELICYDYRMRPIYDDELVECTRIKSCYWVLYGKSTTKGCGKCYLSNFKINDKLK